MMNEEVFTCLNCGETKKECACMRNICIKCGKPVGNITFSFCDKCWKAVYYDLLEEEK